MVLLKSLECSQCHDRLYPYYVLGKQPVLVRGCSYCGGLFCGKCVQTGISRRCSDQQRQQYQNTPDIKCELNSYTPAPHYAAMAYFDKFAPADEMRLLSLQRWSPLYCRSCSSRKRVNSKGYMFCPCCLCWCLPKDCKEMGCSAETKIICELNELLTNDSRKAIRPKRIQLPRQVCSVCGDPVGGRNVTDDGRIACPFCCGSNQSHYIWNIECTFYFDVFLEYLPDVGDLKLLTYSKWTPFKCEKCSVLFSEIEENLPILDKNLHKILCQKCTDEENSSENRENFITLHLLIDIIKEFRRYFKNNGIDCETKENVEDVIPLATQPEYYLEEQLLEVTSLICNLKASIPDTPRCQCGRYEAIEKMKNCSTCHINAICRDCLVEYHWTHQITDTMPELLVEVVNHESEKIQRKLGKWRLRLDQTNSKGKETFGNLVTAYEKLFLKALESKDPAELHNLLSLGDFSELDDFLIETMATNYKAFEKMNEFCAKLKGEPASGMMGKRHSSTERQTMTRGTVTAPKSAMLSGVHRSTHHAQAAEDGPQMNKKSKESFGNLVSTYEALFLKALESKTHEELNRLISLLDDFSKIDDLLMDSITENFKTFEKIDAFCAEQKEFYSRKLDSELPELLAERLAFDKLVQLSSIALNDKCPGRGVHVNLIFSKYIFIYLFQAQL